MWNRKRRDSSKTWIIESMSKPQTTVPLYQVDAFAEHLFSGNPAAVCFLDESAPEGAGDDMASSPGRRRRECQMSAQLATQNPQPRTYEV